MKIQTFTKITSLALASAVLISACGGGSSTSLVSSPSTTENEITSVPATPTSGELSTAEIEGLLFMREEEELARDLYLDIYAAKNNRLKTFKNISDNSETKHAEAIRVLLEKYGIDDPSTGQRNTYTSAELQALYDQLLNIAVGSDDLAALRVGALVEETDIEDINAEIAQVSLEHQDIIATYENLLCGSRNHLRAFVKQIENLTGTNYVIQIPALESVVLDILNTNQEQCTQ